MNLKVKLRCWVHILSTVCVSFILVSCESRIKKEAREREEGFNAFRRQYKRHYAETKAYVEKLKALLDSLPTPRDSVCNYTGILNPALQTEGSNVNLIWINDAFLLKTKASNNDGLKFANWSDMMHPALQTFNLFSRDTVGGFVELNLGDSLSNERYCSLLSQKVSPYALLIKEVRMEAEADLKSNTFKGGWLLLNTWLIDMRHNEVLCSFNVLAQPEKVMVELDGSMDDVSAKSAIEAKSWGIANETILRKLKPLCR